MFWQPLTAVAWHLVASEKIATSTWAKIIVTSDYDVWIARALDKLSVELKQVCMYLHVTENRHQNWGLKIIKDIRKKLGSH